MSDDARLTSLGYSPQLDRVLSPFANFSVAFTCLSPMVGIYSLFALGVARSAGRSREAACRSSSGSSRARSRTCSSCSSSSRSSCGTSVQGAGSRLAFSYARDEPLPASGWLARVHPRFKTPINVVAAVGAVVYFALRPDRRIGEHVHDDAEPTGAERL